MENNHKTRVGALVFSKGGEVLLIKRTGSDRELSSLWDIPHVYSDDPKNLNHLVDSMRELFGLSITVKNTEPIVYRTESAEKDNRHVIFAAVHQDGVPYLDPTEYEDHAWVSLFSLPNYETTQHLNDCLEAIFED